MNSDEIRHAAEHIAAMRKHNRPATKQSSALNLARRSKVLGDLEALKAESGEYDLKGLLLGGLPKETHPAPNDRGRGHAIKEIESAPILQLIKHKPRTSREISAAVGVEVSRITLKMRALEAAGLVAKCKKNGIEYNWIKI